MYFFAMTRLCLARCPLRPKQSASATHRCDDFAVRNESVGAQEKQQGEIEDKCSFKKPSIFNATYTHFYPKGGYWRHSEIKYTQKSTCFNAIIESLLK